MHEERGESRCNRTGVYGQEGQIAQPQAKVMKKQNSIRTSYCKYSKTAHKIRGSLVINWNLNNRYIHILAVF